MIERRKPSTRYRGEPPLKRRALTPPPQPPLEPVAIEAENGLPTKLKDGHSLPTLKESQSLTLPLNIFQDISESGVLAASIERSRQKWLTEGVFERYWAKPSKKKPQVDVQNPAKESMSKLGVCSMIIEPHVFEVTLYNVKELQYNYMPPAPPSVPAISQHAGPSFIAPYGHVTQASQNNLVGNTQPHFQPPRQPSSNTSQPILPPFKEGFARFERPALSPDIKVAQRTGNGSSPAVENNKPNNTHNQDSIASPDPVIQMLAARAATDHDLKSLMKVVASGGASQPQLRVFQNHIDELNEIIQNQKNLPQPSATNGGPPSKSAIPAQTLPETVGTTPTNSKPSTDPLPSVDSTPLVAPSPFPQVKTEPLSQYYSQAPPPPKPRAPVRQDISAIVFDFTGGTGDRYIIPKYSILEYLPGNTQVLVSFLVTRKGSTAVSGAYRPNEDYYQPVTIRLSTLNPRMLEPLGKVVAPAEEVRKCMNEVMSKSKPAELVYLATQLQRANEGYPVEKRESGSLSELNSPKTYYPPPNSLLPLR